MGRKLAELHRRFAARAGELFPCAARGVARRGDHQSLADTLELVNLTNAPGTWAAVN